jgi:hypothetical protein
MLNGLRMQFDTWQLGKMAGIEGARLRLLIACTVLDVPDEQIRKLIPGVDELCRRHPRRRAAYNPDLAARPEPEVYYFGDEPEAWVNNNVERYRAYLEGEMKKADAWKSDALQQGKIRARTVYMERRPRHRERKLDLAERCFVTVRRKFLGHSYKDIAFDHVRPRPTTARQMETAENRVKQTVRAVWQEAFPKVKRFVVR